MSSCLEQGVERRGQVTGRGWRAVCWALALGLAGWLPVSGQTVSVDHDATAAVSAGDVITVTARGPANGTAVFSIGNVVRNRPMANVQAGQYTGEYTVRRGETLNGLPVQVTITFANGQKANGQAAYLVGQQAPHGRTTGRARLTIQGLQHSAKAWQRAGATVQFTMTGSAGCQAAVAVPGVVANVPLTETQAGTYSGTWPVPPANVPLALQATAVGRLQRGDAVVFSVAADPFLVDNQAPQVSEPCPKDGSSVGPQPTIALAYGDGSGSGVDATRTRLLVDGQDVTAASAVHEAVVTYRPSQALAVGTHRASVQVQDKAGNALPLVNWQFTVAATAPTTTVTRKVTFEPAAPMAGDVLRVLLQAEAGGRAMFAVGDRVRGIAMAEQTVGQYVGEYTVRRNDNLTGQPVVVTFALPTGQAVEVRADQTVGTAQSRVPEGSYKLTITSPTEGAKADATMVLTGTARPGTKVNITCATKTRTLGILETAGTLPEQTVNVDGQGRWQSQPFDMASVANKGRTFFTFTVVQIDGNTTSPAVVVRVSR